MRQSHPILSRTSICSKTGLHPANALPFRHTYSTSSLAVILSTPPSPAMFRTSIARSSRSLAARSQTVSLGLRAASTASTPISNPTLANIEKRWEGMPPQEQAELWMSLRDRMKVNWAELTPQEKKAGM
jgi:hypothetical protein